MATDIDINYGGSILANDMTALMTRIFEDELGLILLEPHLPEKFNRDSCAKKIRSKTMETFSRYLPNQLKIQINDDTCYKKRDGSNVMWYYIKDEVIDPRLHLMGITDLDWMDTSARNSGLSTGIGNGYYAYDVPCITGTLESIVGLQLNADFASLYNRQIWVDFEYPTRFALKGLGNISYDLNSFILKLLVNHIDLSTISPTKMEIFTELAICDIAQYLYMNLRYIDGLETAYVNLDLKLGELQERASQRPQVIEELKNANTSAANDNCPIIWSI